MSANPIRQRQSRWWRHSRRTEGERYHGVRIRDEAIRAAVELTERYLPARQLPDKAISVLDTAAAAVALARQTTPGALSDLRQESMLLEQERSWLAREPLDERNHS